MLPKIRIIPNLSKILVAGLVLGVIPWIVSGYIFPRADQHHSSRQIADISKTPQLPPRLFPVGERVSPLLPRSKQNSMVLTSATPEEQPSADQTTNEVLNEMGIVENAVEDTSSKPQDVEDSIPELSPALNSPILPDRSPSLETISTAPSLEAYPSTFAPVGPIVPEEMLPAEMRVHEPEAVSFPAASLNHGSVQPEAVYCHPAVQKTTPLTLPERAPAEPELLPPSTEPVGSSAAQSAALPARSEQLESIARQADQEIRHGFELAGRGAHYGARSEFIAALRLVAQGLDTDQQTTIHGKSLAAGLRALKEAEDFFPRGSMIEAHLDISALVASHSTPALKNTDNTQITALQAVKSYLTYAQGQFAAAVEGEFAGSMALRALGKLHEELAKNQRTEILAAVPKAVVFYQAALLVAPENYLAANDLGVMLAKGGNLQGARAILEHSASIGRQSTVLQNLAKVYQRLGYIDLAVQTHQQSLFAQQAEQARRQTSGLLSANGSVQWVAPETFARTSPNLSTPPAIANNPATPARANITTPQIPPAPSKTNSFGSNNPHWSPNYKQRSVTGQMPRADYQR